MGDEEKLALIKVSHDKCESQITIYYSFFKRKIKVGMKFAIYYSNTKIGGINYGK